MANSKLASDSSFLKTITTECNTKPCVFCGHSTVDEVNLGPLYSRNGVICHYYCLLFCCNLGQNGIEDSDGIMGFLTKDITNEVTRVQRKKSRNYDFYKCSFCHKAGATIGCFVKECSIKFHFPCGLKNMVNFRFTSKFASYCNTHANLRIYTAANFINRPCPVCAEPLNKNDMANIVIGRCCALSIYHRECLQPYALNAGSHFFKCPTCADKETFVKDAKIQGVFVPEKDAEWEQEHNAFRDLRQRYSRCDAPKCQCPSGRDRKDKERGSNWYLLRCHSCAASGTHVKCSSSRAYMNVPGKWLCQVCINVAARLRNNRIPNSTATNAIAGSSSSSSQRTLESDASQDDVSCSSDTDSLFSAVAVVRATQGHSDDHEDDMNSDSSSESLFSNIRPSQCPLDDEISDSSSSESLFSVARLPLRKVILYPPVRKIPRMVLTANNEANNLNYSGEDNEDDSSVVSCVSSEETLFIEVKKRSRPTSPNQTQVLRDVGELRRSSRKRAKREV